ncbi:glucosamine-6-phosphate deaminase [Luteolibacter ambystomatis]|uniref:Glucosamine-6-phosphate deaminase n=1 Tax=Luteolibacter ambystomatis TaxID=2824561 RepID=A0A975PG51_9BACT|nr:glucosamine-6-phosphate deaminase [Luteolibacter ambystomatis]QUE52300.1 glucosamine-6-phosphate deaminase [Luteolibacter ambystomatis]
MNSVSFRVFDSSDDAARELAAEVAELIRSRAAEGRNAVLGLATGNTPLPFYRELIRLHQEEGLSFGNVITFNLDEYLGLERDHPESYWTFMHRNLFDHLDIAPDNVNLPSGTVADSEVAAHCAAYEDAIREAGGLDFQLLGIGRTGHIGFNEPGSEKNSITRRVHLDPVTRADAAPAFGGLDNVPTYAITMGCATILSAKRIALLAWGDKKASIVKAAIEGPITDQISASFLQEHGNTTYFLDRGAASLLA